MRDLEKANARNANINALSARLESNAAQKKTMQQKIDDLQASIAMCDADTVETEAAIHHAGDSVDTDAITAQIDSAEGVNQKVRGNRKRAEIMAQAIVRTKEADDFTDQIMEIDREKQAAMAALEYPIEGLSISDDGTVEYNGLPFNQASGAEKLRVSAAIGLALNPKMGVFLVRDASLLDRESLAALQDFAEANGAQAWIERVGDGDECTVIIEDGEVIEQR